jgi:hypothetical protein
MSQFNTVLAVFWRNSIFALHPASMPHNIENYLQKVPI